MNVKEGLLILLSGFMFYQTQAQEKNVYEGAFKHNQENGNASFEYFLNDEGEKIKDGDFQWTLKSTGEQNKNHILKKSQRGTYNYNKKSGKWDYKEENHWVTINDVKDMKVSTSLKSRVSKLQAAYLENIPHGEWGLKVESYKDGKTQTDLLSENILFRQGNITGNFLVNGKENPKVVGFTNKAGVMDSVWTFNYYDRDVPVKETRKYHNGILLEVLKQHAIEKDTLDFLLYNDAIEKLQALKDNPDTSFGISGITFELEFNDGYGADSKELIAQAQGNILLDSIIKEVIKYDASYYMENGSFVRTPIKTRRFKYSLSDIQENKKNEISALFKKLNKITAQQLENEALNDNRDKSDSLEVIYQYFSSLGSSLPKLNDLIAFISSDEAIYYADPYHLYVSNKGLFAKHDSISLSESNENPLIINYSKALNDSLSVFENVHSILTYQLNLVNKFIKQIEPLVHKVKTQEEFRNIKANIEAKKAKVDTLYKGYTHAMENEHNLVREVQVKFLYKGLEEKLKAMDSDGTYQSSILKGGEILLYLREMKNIYEPLSLIYDEMDKTDKLYTNEKGKREKKKLYEAAEVLFKHYVNKLQEESDFYLLKTHVGNFEKLQYRMLELREQNTKSLEKSLKKTTDPDEIAKLLKL
ncbi:hypothetical protein RCC89_02090 [Cytophagaceae bacterium ABcell3]|nr:hypothetical protein RCC89_02090 [Cytophagaceae bacterium ABcell3]